MTNEEKYFYYRELTFECINIRDKTKTMKDYRFFQRKAEKYMRKARRFLKNEKR